MRRHADPDEHDDREEVDRERQPRVRRAVGEPRHRPIIAGPYAVGMEPTTVLYDEDCGFCRWTADKLRGWDRHAGYVRLDPGSARAGAVGGRPARGASGSAHVVTAGHVRSGGAAVAPVLRELPGGRPLAVVAEAMPRVTDRAYRWTARRRTWLGARLGDRGLRGGSEPPGCRRMNLAEATDALRAAADPSRKPGMARVGIRIDDALGVSVPDIRRIAKRAGIDQALADGLWATGIHEARYLATMVADPAALHRRADGSVGCRHRLLGRRRRRCRSVRREPAPRANDPRMGRPRGAVREARRVRDDRAARRLGPGSVGRRVHAILRADPARRVRRSQRGQEGRELGAAPDREAEPRRSTPRPSGRRSGSSPRGWAAARAAARWVGRDVLRELRADGTQERLR